MVDSPMEIGYQSERPSRTVTVPEGGTTNVITPWICAISPVLYGVSLPAMTVSMRLDVCRTC